MTENIPTLTLFNTIEYEADTGNNRNQADTGVIFSYDTALCTSCSTLEDKGDEFEYHRGNIFSPSNSLTSNCCYSPLCPNCVQITHQMYDYHNNNHIKVTYWYLFIKDVIYLQDEEREPRECEYNDVIQDNWVVYKQRQQINLDNYKEVDKEYNYFGCKNFKKDPNNYNICYTDICCVCVCKHCGFECLVRGYMDS